MTRYEADWILPIADPPIREGWVVVDRGRIVAFGRRRDPAAPSRAARRVPLGAVAILPGLVNAHTHLELSYLRDTIPPQPSFVPWVRDVIRAQRQRADPCAPAIVDAIAGAIAEARASGTAAVGDISNTLASFAPLATSRLRAVVFKELIGFRPEDPAAVVDGACAAIDALAATARVRASLAAHAPYSVAPLLFRAIRRAIDRRPFLPCSVHLAESREEVEFIATGQGAWRRLLEDLGSWDANWVPPGVSPVRYLAEAGFLDEHVLVVHGVQAKAADLARLATLGATLVTCPRSNRHTGAGDPPAAAFYKAGLHVAIGTDSLASAPDLNLFAELAALHALAPDVPASALLDSATRQGARALGMDAEIGTIAPGKAAALVAVQIPPGTADVEEYLVRGVAPDRIAWLDDEAEP